MRKFMICAAALFVGACGGETYQVPASEAFQTLSNIGNPPLTSPMPGALSPVSVQMESVPADNSVQWLFRHDGDDIGRIVATVTPDGDAASTIRLGYYDGSAPDDKWRNAQVRRLLRDQMQRLFVEQVDSTFEKREFNDGLKKDVNLQVTSASMGALMNDVSASMNDHIKKQNDRASSASANPYTATKPSTDLTKYN
jgi:hypothetical protein